LTKEEQLTKSLEKVNSVEEKIKKHIEEQKAYLVTLNEKKANVEKGKAEINKKIEIIEEEKKKNPPPAGTVPPTAETAPTHVEEHKKEAHAPAAHGKDGYYKKIHYVTPDMEVEEVFSHDPTKCYKLIRKTGEAPQVIVGEEFLKLHSEEHKDKHCTKSQKTACEGKKEGTCEGKKEGTCPSKAATETKEAETKAPTA